MENSSTEPPSNHNSHHRMTVSASFNLQLNQIYDLIGQTSQLKAPLGFNLVKFEETSYLNFQLLSKLPPLFDTRLIELITNAKYVSLTKNSFYLDLSNSKLVLKPLFLNNVYVFDINDDIGMIEESLGETALVLDGFMNYELLNLELGDYEMKNGKFLAALA